jgi:hypothetical protein
MLPGCSTACGTDRFQLVLVFCLVLTVSPDLGTGASALQDRMPQLADRLFAAFQEHAALMAYIFGLLQSLLEASKSGISHSKPG